MSAAPVRRQAYDILLAVADGAALDPLLDTVHDRWRTAGRPRRDAAFLTELVRGTLQWQARYDHLVDTFSRRRPPTDPRLRVVLRLALHQLVGMDGVPARAAIHEAGELCRERISARLVGFVNGMLQGARRQLRPADDLDPAERRTRLRAAFAALEGDGPAWLAAWHSLPVWLVERWLRQWEPATAATVCAAVNERPPVAFRVLEGAEPVAVAADLGAAGCPVGVGDDSRTLVCLERPGRDLLTRLLADRPQLIVQDPTVQEATGWLLDALPAVDRPLLDLCAAPGGKTARLAAGRPGRTPLVAADLRASRLPLLRSAAKRIEARPVPVVLADGMRPPFAPASFAGVLVDGPCSGTGVLRHHPEGRWLLRPDTPRRNGMVLLELARQACGLLEPGGVLLYATCSLEAEENERVIGALLHAVPGLEPAPDAAGRWQRRWLPGQAPGDGFYAARLRARDDGKVDGP
jgi:16S rRNA (cytosine967-C5)-methyltransferase